MKNKRVHRSLAHLVSIFIFFGTLVHAPLPLLAAQPTAPSPTEVPTCQPSGGTGGLSAGSHDVTIAGRPAHVIVSPFYDPANPTYLSFYLHGSEGGYNYNRHEFNELRQFVEEAGWIYVAPQAPADINFPDAHPWHVDGDPGPLTQANEKLVADVLDYMFTNYNVCTNILLGSSVSSGSHFYDRLFFPRYGDRYPAFMNIGCGAGHLDSKTPSYQDAVLLSQNAEVVARSELHYTIGTADFLYDDFLVSSATYQDLGFSVSTDVLQDVEHCAYNNAEKSAVYWRQKLIALTPHRPAQIAITSGNNQYATSRQPFTEPLVVTVLDANQEPFPGVVVKFRVISPDHAPSYEVFGKVSSDYVETNEHGQAQVLAEAGSSHGEFQVTASTLMLDAPITFTLTSGDPFAAFVEKVSGDQQQAVIGRSYAQPLLVEVQNSKHEPISGATVTFEILAFDGEASVTLSSDIATTDTNGQASVTAQANQQEGPLSVSASVYSFVHQGDIPSATFSLTNVLPLLSKSIYLPLVEP